MRVLVCGGRTWTDFDSVYGLLDDVHDERPIECVIEGNSRGVDRMAGYWARKNSIHNLKFPALWEKYGKSAGPRRNLQMIVEGKPDLVIAFPGGKGTADMVRQAKLAGVEILEFGP